MLGLLCILVGAFFVCAVLTPLAREAAARCGLIDLPDAGRKNHGRPVPLAGGIAVLASVFVVLGIGLAVSDDILESFAVPSRQFVGLSLAALAICALGVLDDYQCLRGRHKLVGQIAVVGILLGFDLQIRIINLFGTDIELGIFAIPITVLWLLGAINSLNLIDGMDGLLSSVGFIMLASMAALAVLLENWAAAFVAAAMAGSLLGFLCYNFPPASVFLGDAGSMLTGLVVGFLGIQSSLKAPATVALMAPVAILTIPFLDTLAAITRRKLTGRSIYTTDRGHLHHCLLRRGMSARRTLLVISLLCLLTVVGGLASLAMRNELVAVIAILSVVFMLVATRLFGDAELSLFAKRVRHLAVSFFEAPGAGKSRRLEVHLQGSTAWSGLLEALAHQAFELNLLSVRLEINAPAIHEHYHGQWNRFEQELEGATLWRAELPLAVRGRIVGQLAVAGFHDLEPLVEKIAAVVELMETFKTALGPDEVSSTAAAEISSKGANLKVATALPPPHVFGAPAAARVP